MTPSLRPIWPQGTSEQELKCGHKNYPYLCPRNLVGILSNLFMLSSPRHWCVLPKNPHEPCLTSLVMVTSKRLAFMTKMLSLRTAEVPEVLVWWSTLLESSLAWSCCSREKDGNSLFYSKTHVLKWTPLFHSHNQKNLLDKHCAS